MGTAREGRQLEELIAILEKAICGTDIQIKSPDIIKDKVTGEGREVDVSLRGVVGSHDILIILECRDRKAPQDVTWIEQLASKRDDIRANKAIAVSSSGFTRGAIEKARDRGIELRTLEDIKPEEILEWFRGDAVHLIRKMFAIKNVLFQCDTNQTEPEKSLKLKTYIDSEDADFRSDQKIFLLDESNESVSLDQLVLPVIDALSEIDVMNGEKVEETYVLASDGQGGGISIVIDEIPIELQHIQITADVWVEKETAGVQAIKAYKKDGNTFAHVVNFGTLNFPDGEHLVEIHRIPKGDLQQISIRLTKKEENHKVTKPHKRKS